MSNIFEKHSKIYDAWYDKYRFAYLSELKVLKKVIPKQGKSLEIGVGTGRFASVLGINLGIDSSYEMIEIARQRGVAARWGFGEDLPFFNSTFNLVAIIVTLSFVNNPLKVLQEARRVLEDDGKLVVGIIDKNSFLGKFYQTKKSIFYKKADLFTVERLRNLLKIAGFRQFSCWQTIFKLPSEIDSLEKPRKGFGKGGFVVINVNNSRDNS
ncbi:MAG: methyltransferase domain-containing protein [Candidatus Omnitrophota bacterium]